MTINVSPEQWAANFIDMWATRPGMVMSSDRSPLDRVQAFLAGLKWASAFRDAGLDRFETFLQTLERKLSSDLSGSDNGICWFETLLERNNGDQQQAFLEFIELLRNIATREQVVTPIGKL